MWVFLRRLLFFLRSVYYVHTQAIVLVYNTKGTYMSNITQLATAKKVIIFNITTSNPTVVAEIMCSNSDQINAVLAHYNVLNNPQLDYVSAY
jgi:hypothetical protein